MAYVFVRTSGASAPKSVEIAEGGSTVGDVLRNGLQMDNVDKKQIAVNGESAGLTTHVYDNDVIAVTKGTENG